MDENVLIVSKVSKPYILFTKIVILIFSLAWITFLGIGITTAVIKHSEFKYDIIQEAYQSKSGVNDRYECYGEHYHWGSIYPSVTTEYFDTEKDFWEHYKSQHSENIVSLFEYGKKWFVFNFLFFILAGLQIFKLCAYTKNKIIVTPKTVYAKTMLGAKMVLPIEKITAYGATKIFSRIIIHAVRGTIMLTFVVNNWEIMEVLAKLINESKEQIEANDGM